MTYLDYWFFFGCPLNFALIYKLRQGPHFWHVGRCLMTLLPAARQKVLLPKGFWTVHLGFYYRKWHSNGGFFLSLHPWGLWNRVPSQPQSEKQTFILNPWDLGHLSWCLPMPSWPIQKLWLKVGCLPTT